MNSNLSDETISALLPVEGGVWCGGKRLTFVSAASSQVQISGGDSGAVCRALFISKEESQIWAGWETGAITIHDLFKSQGRTMLSELHQHTAAVTQIVGTPRTQNSPNIVISTSEDGQIALWNESTHHVIRTMQVEGSTGIIISHLWGTVLVAGCTDHTVQLWDILEGEMLVSIAVDARPTALTTDQKATQKAVGGADSTLGSLWSGLQNGVVSVFDLSTTEVSLSSPAHNHCVILITSTSSDAICSLDSSGCFIIWSGLTQLQKSKGVTGNYQVACLYEKSLWMGQKHAMGTPLATCNIDEVPDPSIVKLKPSGNKTNFISKQLSTSELINNINIDTHDVVSRCSSASIRSDSSAAILQSQLKERLSLEQQKNADLKKRNNDESQLRSQAQQELLVTKSRLSDLMRENETLRRELEEAKRSQLQNDVRAASIHGLQNELVEAKLYIRVLEGDLSKRDSKTTTTESDTTPDELQTLKDQLSEALSCSKASRSLCDQFKLENEELTKKLSKDALAIELKQLQSELSMSEELAVLNEDRITEFKKQVSIQDERISELKELLSSKEVIISGLEETVSSLKKKQKQSAVTNTEFNTMAQNLQQQASSLKQNQLTLQEQRDSLQSQIDSCVAQILESEPSLEQDDPCLSTLLSDVLINLTSLRTFKNEVSSLPGLPTTDPTPVNIRDNFTKLNSVSRALDVVDEEFFGSSSDSPSEVISKVKARLRAAPSHSEVALLKETLSDLKAENESLRMSRPTQEEATCEAALQADIATLRAENTILKSGGGSIGTLRETIKSLTDENNNLRSQSQQRDDPKKEDEIAALHESVAALAAENSAIRDTNNSLRRTAHPADPNTERELTLLRGTIASLKEENETLTEVIRERDSDEAKRMRSAEAVANINTKTGNTMTSIIAHTQEEISEHCSDRNSDYKQLKNEKNELEATLESVRRGSELLRSQNDQLNEELSLLKSRSHDPDADTMTSLRLKNAELEDTIASLRSNLGRESTAAGSNQSTITSLQRRNSALESQTSKLKEKRRADKNAMKSLHKEVVDLAEQSQSMYEEMKKTELERKNYQQLSQKLEQDINELRDAKVKEVEAVKKQHAASIRSNREAEHRVATVANELATVLAAKEQEHHKATREETLRKKAERKMNEVLSSRSQSAESLHSEALASENIALKMENSRLQSEISQRHSTPSKGRSVSGSSAKEISILKSENTRLQSQLSRLQSTSSSKSRSVSDASAREMSILKAENSRLQSELSHRSQSGRSASGESEKEISLLKAENERLQMELVEANQSIRSKTCSDFGRTAEGRSESPEIKKEASIRTNDTIEMNTKEEASPAACHDSESESGLISENTFLKAKVADLKRSLTASAAESANLKEATEKAAALREESDAYLQQLTEENDFLITENEELKSQIEDKSKEATNGGDDSSELENNLKSLKETNSNLIDALTAANTELTTMKEQLLEYSERETDVTTDHELTQQELVKVKAELQESKLSLEKLTSEVNNLQQVIDQEDANQKAMKEEFAQVVKELDAAKESLATEKKRRKARTYPSSITLSSPGSGKLFSGEYNMTRELHGGVPIYKTSDGKILTGAKRGIKAIHKKVFICSPLLNLTIPTTYSQPWTDQVGNNVEISFNTIGRVDISKEIQQTSEEEFTKTDEMNLELDGIKKELIRLQKVESKLKQLQIDHEAVIQIIESLSDVVKSDASLTSEFVIMGGDRADWLDNPSLELEDRIRRAFIRNYVWGAGESRFPKELRDAPTLPEDVRLERALQREELLVAEDDVTGFTDCTQFDDISRTIKQRLRDTLKRINSRLANRITESDVDTSAPILRPALPDDNLVPRVLQDGSSLPLADRLVRVIRRERWRITICSPQTTTQPDDPTLRSQLIVALQRESWLAGVLPIQKTSQKLSKLSTTPRRRLT
eukprot:TRINITY_DN11223_c0_g2_i2.p1 TRINITY_DN11223_c0_g2~~TRINITY_DN11223_c0_g2_i2.p1  ORF type:complete len:1944 (+),score=484.91 TRINITY_DN11223_c0_g2_i2:51-5834(+)